MPSNQTLLPFLYIFLIEIFFSQMTVAKRKAILFLFGCSEVNSTWLFTSELANQRARKALFTKTDYTESSYHLVFKSIEVISPDRISFTAFESKHIWSYSSSVFWISAGPCLRLSFYTPEKLFCSLFFFSQHHFISCHCALGNLLILEMCVV